MLEDYVARLIEFAGRHNFVGLSQGNHPDEKDLRVYYLLFNGQYARKRADAIAEMELDILYLFS